MKLGQSRYKDNCSRVIIVVILFSIGIFSGGKSHACNCSYSIGLTQSYVDGSLLSLKGGDTICIESGNRGVLRLANFHGDSLRHLVFKNCGGDVIVRNTSGYMGISINNCSYFRFTGSGSASSKYGIKVLKTPKGSNGLSIDGFSTNYEIDCIEVANTGFAGIMAVANPSCDGTLNRGNFVVRNSSFHDNYIHNTGGEGFYIGHSFYTGYPSNCDGKSEILFPAEIKGIRVFNNIIDSTGWDGLQVSCATSDCEIYGNMITNYGISPENYQNSGIQIGGGTTGRCYNNAIMNGSGTGIMVFGLGNNLIYNNIIINAGKTANVAANSRVYGIFCDDRSTIEGWSFSFINNTIIAPKTDGIRIYSNHSRNNKIYNNLILSPGSYGSYRNSLQSYIFYNSDVDLDISNNYFSQKISASSEKDSLNEVYQFTATLPVFFKGKDVSAYGITYDYYKTPRPEGIDPDIGAFQFIKDSKRTDSTVYIYPNPNNGKFMIVNKGNNAIEKITIYSLNGKNIYEQKQKSGNSFFVHLPAYIKKGYYIIGIETTVNKKNYSFAIN